MQFMYSPEDGDVLSIEERNRQSFYRVALLTVASLFVVSTLPHVLVLAALSALLFIGSLAMGAMALVALERPFAEHLTRWDEALTLFGFSILCKFFVDPVAVAQTMAAAS